jgi:aspartyl-tRNA(Asn)/glutamyl-tRNA(Gln) amidotransferase subunit A
MLQATPGYDPEDTSSAEFSLEDYAEMLCASICSLRLRLPRAYFYENLDPEVQSAVEVALSVLRKFTASQVNVAPLAAGKAYTSILEIFTVIVW